MAQTNNPTFNRANTGGSVPGFYSRTLFTYTSNSNNIYNLAGTDWVGVTDFDGIGDLISNDPTSCHGDYIIPEIYWTPGKTIRIKGALLCASGDADELFNMRFGLQETNGPTTEWLAIQNSNASDHTFALGAIKGPLPVDFACDIVCSGYDETYTYLVSSGYYQYNPLWFDSNGGTNVDGIYVPVWYNKGFVISYAPDFYLYKNKIMFNLNGTSLSASIYLTNLTIEELA